MAAKGQSKGPIGPVIVFFLFSVVSFILSMTVFSRTFPTLDQMNITEGEIKVISTREQILSGTITSVEFLCGTATFHYSKTAADFPRIRDRLFQGGKMKIWYLAADTISGPRTGILEVYRITSGDEEILSYDDAVSHMQVPSRVLFWVSIGLLVLGCIRGGMLFMGTSIPQGAAKGPGSTKLDMSKIRIK